MNTANHFSLPYLLPYCWDRMLSFLAMRAIPGVETVQQGAYWRTVRAYDGSGNVLCGWIRAENNLAKSQIEIEFADNLAPAADYLKKRLKHLFDTERNPAAIGSKLESMNEYREGSFVAGTRIPGCYDGFEMACRAVLGQQISVKGASTLAGRIASHFGTPLDTDIPGLEYLFPTPADIRALAKNAPIEESLGSLGIIGTRCRTMLALAELLERDPAAIEPCAKGGATPEEKISELVKLPGIGEWTAHYIAMRSMGWSDAFPATDLGIIKFLGTKKKKELVAAAEKWRPWRSYAVMNMWTTEQAELQETQSKQTAKSGRTKAKAKIEAKSSSEMSSEKATNEAGKAPSRSEQNTRSGTSPKRALTSRQKNEKAPNAISKEADAASPEASAKKHKAVANAQAATKHQNMPAIATAWYETPFMGRVMVAATDQAIVGLWMEGQKYFGASMPCGIVTENSDHPLIRKAFSWLDRYYAGEKPATSELTLEPQGSAFRQVIWKLLCEIPYGQTSTYGELAEKAAELMGKEHMASLAVGGAVGHNPISVIIPCHRVVGANGSLTGYAGGLHKKIALLEHEGVDTDKLFRPVRGTAL